MCPTHSWSQLSLSRPYRLILIVDLLKWQGYPARLLTLCSGPGCLSSGRSTGGLSGQAQAAQAAKVDIITGGPVFHRRGIRSCDSRKMGHHHQGELCWEAELPGKAQCP